MNLAEVRKYFARTREYHKLSGPKRCAREVYSGHYLPRFLKCYEDDDYDYTSVMLVSNENSAGSYTVPVYGVGQDLIDHIYRYYRPR